MSRFSQSHADANGLPQSARITLDLGITAAGLANPVNHDVALMGPGDVGSLLPNQIQRREPESGASGFEHNAFPFVEFSDPGLPWRYTPAGPNTAQARLAPWMVLAVVPDAVPNLIRSGSNGLRMLDIGQFAGQLLPDPSDAWAWAHIQQSDVGDFSRILCPTKLEPDTAYIAALVPLFEAGRLAGLAQEVDEASIGGSTAWTADTQAITLPVYDHWRFSTGAEGFEALADKLFPAPPQDDFGRRDMDVTDPAPGFAAHELSNRAGGERLDRQFSGAMVAAGTRAARWEASHKEAFQKAMETVLVEAGSAGQPPARGKAYDPLHHDAVVAPPGYGDLHNDHAPVAATWARAANLDPRHRAVAGLAARAFRAKQEDYVALAWKALAEARDATRKARALRSAAVLNTAVHTRIASLPRAMQLQISRPVHSNVKARGQAQSLRALIGQDDAIAQGAVSQAMTRFIVARGRRFLKPGRIETVEKVPPLGGTSEGLLEDFLKGRVPRQRQLGLSTISGRARNYAILASAGGGSAPGPATFTKNGDLQIATPGLNGTTTQTLKGGVLSAPPSKPKSQSAPKPTRKRRGTKKAQPLKATQDPKISRVVSPKAPFLEKSLKLAPKALAAPLNRPSQGLELTVQALNGLIAPAPKLADKFTTDISAALVRPFEKAPIPREVSQAIQFDAAAVNDIALRAPSVMVPGAETVPLNGVSLVATNPAFVSTYLLGVNHECAREFAWRNIPTPLNDTWFNRFWDYIDPDRFDIDPIDGWGKSRTLTSVLTSSTPATVVLTRAELLRRYPDTIIYAVPAHWDEKNNHRTVRTSEFDKAIPPSFDGSLGNGLRYVGFDLSPEEMIGAADQGNVAGEPGWFIVFEEPIFAPRFGLDAYEGPRTKGVPENANDLHWGDFVPDAQTWEQLTQVPLAPAWAKQEVEGHFWGQSAGGIAALTWQRPVRVMIHADRLVST